MPNNNDKSQVIYVKEKSSKIKIIVIVIVLILLISCCGIAFGSMGKNNSSSNGVLPKNSQQNTATISSNSLSSVSLTSIETTTSVSSTTTCRKESYDEIISNNKASEQLSLEYLKLNEQSSIKLVEQVLSETFRDLGCEDISKFKESERTIFVQLQMNTLAWESLSESEKKDATQNMLTIANKHFPSANPHLTIYNSAQRIVATGEKGLGQYNIELK